MKLNLLTWQMFVKNLRLRARQKSGFGGLPWRLAKNIYMDLRYGGRFVGGMKESPFKEQGAYPSGNSDYRVLKEVFALEPIRPDDVVVDVGCAWGRVINFLVAQGIKNRIVGLELDPEVAEDARGRLSRYANVAVIPGDALANLPADGTLFFMYNPFNAAIMERFRDRCRELYAQRHIRLIYQNCMHLDVFRDHPDWHIRQEVRLHEWDLPVAFIESRWR